MGAFGLPIKLDRDSIVAITDGDLDQELDALEQLISAVENDEDILISDRLDRLVEFHLDIPGFPSWSPMGYSEDVPRLNLYDALEGRS